MLSTILKPKISRLSAIGLIQPFCIYLLYSISCSVWAQGQVDLQTPEPVLTYQLSHEILSENDSLKIQVYSDGYAVLHYPSYMKKSGDYSVQLSQGDLQRLLHTLNTPGIRGINNKSIGLQKASEDSANDLVTFVSDSSHSSFKVSRSDEYGNNKTKQNIKYPHLQYDAKHHPKIHTLKQLAEVESLLSKLIDQPDVQELDYE